MSYRICLLIFLNYLLFISNKEVHKVKKNEAETFTQKDNVGLYRLSSTVVSPNKDFTVFVSSKWDEESGKTITNLKFKKIDPPESEVLNLTPPTDDKSDFNPVFSAKFPNLVFFLRAKDERVHIYYMPLESEAEPTQLTTYPIDVDNLKIEGYTMVFSGFMFDQCDDMECTAKEEEEIKQRGANTYQIYTELMVRHWDHWYVENETSHVWMQKLEESETPTLKEGPIDLLSSNKHVSSPPFEGGSDQFSISPDEKYIAFSGQEKNEKMAYNTKWDIYLYNVENKELKVITNVEDQKGRCQNPAFNEKSNKLAFLSMDRYGLESDYLKMRIYDLENEEIKKPKFQGDWKPAVSGFVWSNSDDDIFIYNALEEGYLKLYEYHFNEEEANAFFLLTNDTNGYSGNPIKLDENKYLIEYSSFTFPNVIGILTKTEETSKILSSTEIVNLNKDKLSNYKFHEPESFYYNSTNDTIVQGFILKPIDFDETSKYPLAFLIHGGPEGAWENVWSYRWNPQIWSHRNYAVVFINPRGSSGMGIKFQDAVRNDWGGAPFNDLMEGFDYVIENYTFIDENRAGACGASYGGFMVNWIQGNDKDKRFKCLVTHDGVFSTITMFYATEELWFPMAEYCKEEEIGCKPYEEGKRDGYEKFNPERFVQNWSTPHLIIHGGKDYRIPISEGISAFTALQLKKVPSRFLYFPDENHWVLKPENSIKWYDEVLGWLDKYLN